MEFESYLESANRENQRFIKKAVQKALKFWWLIAGSALLFVVIAFLVIRYSPKIYSIGAKVMIEKSSEGFDPTNFLFGEQLIGGSQEVVNELIILKSFPIIQKTVIDVGQNIHYYRTTTALERTIEIEPEEAPFKVNVSSDWQFESGLISSKKPIRIEFLDSGYKLFQGDVTLFESAAFGEVLTIENRDFSIEKQAVQREEEIEVEYFFKVFPVNQTVFAYQESLKSTIAEEKSSIINLTLEASLKKREIQFVQTLLRNYLDANLSEKNQGAANTIDFINQELSSIKDSLKKIEGRLEVFKSRNQISNLQTEGQLIFEKLLELEEEKAQFQLRDKYLSVVNAYLKSDAEAKLVTPSSFGIDDPTLANLTETILKLETEKNLLGENNGEIKSRLDARIQELQKSLNAYVSNIEKSNALQLDEVTKRIRLIEKSIEDIPVSEMALMNIERLHKLSESLYLLLLEKKAEAEITKSSNTPDIKIVEDARLLKSEPVKPNKKLIYGAFLILGLVLPSAWVFLTSYLDRTIRTKEEITDVIDVPFMGYIASSESDVLNTVFDQPKSRLAETFRTVRSNLKFTAGLKDESQIILVSSCFPGEGKTFVSSNLAQSYASAGKSVIVIGADLRKPQLQNQFGLDNKVGLSSYLVGQCEQTEIIKQTESGVDVIVSGPIPPNPLELLDSERFYDLLVTLKTLYDQIIIDTSPFVLVSDATALFGKADFNLLVVRSGVSERSNLNFIKELTQKVSDAKFGIVLNDHDLASDYGYRYAKGYKNGYGYYEELKN